MFTQKISMDCTQEQYEKYLKTELEKMGYESADDFNSMPFNGILTGWNDDYIIQSYNKCGRENDSRTYLGKFNAPLFLALAAMTDKTDGGYGEWWICKESDDGCFTKDCLYRAVGAVNHMFALIDNVGKQEGYCGSNHDHFRKATVSEIMAKFGEQPNKGKIEFEITLDTKALDEQIEKLAMSIQMTEQLIKLEGELRKAFDTKEEPKHKEPIIGELAIGYDNDRTIIGILNVKDKSGTPYKVGGFWCENAVLFENMEQFKAFINE